ncbi:HTH-type transcriptional regulator, GntR family [Gottschalkia purinilytica]|uniref:HTH-type transcriptional regulator, GntR family n=1 Tax=Gottschalkia purinilytica TaxID=1503 RepID=A0A0L0W9X5_GOTPU|nr:PLP-dependent aminotransferase family protein [Gottschalkia purinilytica]KNF08334.1 HTH-type transcriptional regulator, GntR family [Gottschalkia purinilytica]
MKYEDITNYIKQKIEKGEIKSGDKLPTIRKMAEIHKCSKSTVVRAYDELEKEHVIYSVPQSGYYAIEKKKMHNKAKNEYINFSSISPDPDIFPYLEFQHCMDKAMDVYKQDIFTYNTDNGLSYLIDVLEKHLMNYQVFTKPDNIYVTSGIQQALSILAEMPFPNNKKYVLVEQPTYNIFLKLLELKKIPVIGIERGVKGIDLNELEMIFKRDNVKFFYTMPRFQNPLGTSYTAKEKEAIADLARKYDVYIVEDDYLADLENDSKADPIYTYDRSSHVIYLKSFSKILFPGLRLGVAVIPDSMKDKFYLYKKLTDLDACMISQAALSIYINSGMFERYRNKISEIYLERINCLNNALNYYNDTEFLKHENITSGIFNHLTLPLTFNINKLISNLKKKGIRVQSGETFYLSNSSNNNKLIRLSITRVNEEQIYEGISAIIDEIKKLYDLSFY